MWPRRALLILRGVLLRKWILNIGDYLMNHYIISGATIIDVITGSKSAKDIEIYGDRIRSLSPHGSLEMPTDIRVISAEGQFAIPGLCDMHIHLTAWPQLVDSISSLLIAYGVTSVRDMGGRLSDIVAFRQQSRQPGVVAPRIWIAGPIIDGSPTLLDQDADMPALSVSVDTPEDAVDLVSELVKYDIDFIKPYEMLRPEVFKALVQKAQSCNLPAAGHLPMLMSIPEILSLGQYDVQHIVGGSCGGLGFECSEQHEQLMADKLEIVANADPDARGTDLMSKIIRTAALDPAELDSVRRAELIQLFAEQNTWHTPTLVVMAGIHKLGLQNNVDWLNAFDFLPEVYQTKAHAYKNGEENGHTATWGSWYLETVGEMHNAGIKFLAGTDCPPVHSYTPGSCLHFELQALVLAGVSPLGALQAATINAAEFFNCDKELGSIEKGKYADIVLLNADPMVDIANSQRIQAVISKGYFYDREMLDEFKSRSNNASYC